MSEATHASGPSEPSEPSEPNHMRAIAADKNLRFLTKDHPGLARRGKGIEGRRIWPLEKLIGQGPLPRMIHDENQNSDFASGGSKRRRIKPTKRKPITRKSTKRKSIKRKSIKRKSTKRKSTRKKLSKRRR